MNMNINFPHLGIELEHVGRSISIFGFHITYYGKMCIRDRAGTSVQLIGPASPYVGKVRDTYRRVIYLKSEQEAVLVFLKDQLEQYIEINSGFQNLWIQFDLNPMSVF